MADEAKTHDPVKRADQAQARYAFMIGGDFTELIVAVESAKQDAMAGRPDRERLLSTAIRALRVAQSALDMAGEEAGGSTQFSDVVESVIGAYQVLATGASSEEQRAHPGAPEGERWWITSELVGGPERVLTLTREPHWDHDEPVTLLRAPSPPDSEPGS